MVPELRYGEAPYTAIYLARLRDNDTTPFDYAKHGAAYQLPGCNWKHFASWVHAMVVQSGLLFTTATPMRCLVIK